jgi:hypothetical protein
MALHLRSKVIATIFMLLPVVSELAEAQTKLVVVPVRCQSSFKAQNVNISNPKWRQLRLTTKTRSDITLELKADSITSVLGEMLNNTGSYFSVVRKKLDKVLFKKLFTSARTIDSTNAMSMGKLYDSRYLIIPEICSYRCKGSYHQRPGNKWSRDLDLSLAVEFTVVDTSRGLVVFREIFKASASPSESCGGPKVIQLGDQPWIPIKEKICQDFVTRFLKATLKPKGKLPQDKTAPTIKVVSPRSGSLYRRSNVEVIVSCPDKDLRLITINGQPANAYKTKVKLSLFSSTIETVEGLNIIKVSASDHSGNKTTIHHQITCDTRAPLLHLASPGRNSTVNGGNIPIVVICLDKDIASLTIGGREARKGEKGRYTLTLKLTEGAQRIVIKARDHAGNLSVAYAVFTINNQKPKLRLLAPKSDAQLNTNPVNIWVECHDPEIEKVIINGLTAKARGKGRYSVVITASQGLNKIQADAFNRVGNRGSLRSQYRFDSKAPKISAQLSVIVQGKVNDPASTVTINGVRVNVKSDGTYQREVKLGTNRKVVIVATDPFGNSRRIVKKY